MTAPANGATANGGLTPGTPVRLQLGDFLKICGILLVLGTPVTVFAFRLQTQVEINTDRIQTNNDQITKLIDLVERLTVAQTQFISHTARLDAMRADIDRIERDVERLDGEADMP